MLVYQEQLGHPRLVSLDVGDSALQDEVILVFHRAALLLVLQLALQFCLPEKFLLRVDPLDLLAVHAFKPIDVLVFQDDRGLVRLAFGKLPVGFIDLIYQSLPARLCVLNVDLCEEVSIVIEFLRHLHLGHSLKVFDREAQRLQNFLQLLLIVL